MMRVRKGLRKLKRYLSENQRRRGRELVLIAAILPQPLIVYTQPARNLLNLSTAVQGLNPGHCGYEFEPREPPRWE
jgi:hypothetical protein